MRQLIATLTMALVVLPLVGCGAGSSGTDEGDGTAGIDATDGGSEEAEATDGDDETEETASGDGSGGPSCEDFEQGDPCGPEAEALDCSSTIIWCEQEVGTGFCECSAGTWGCLWFGPPGDCHECCAESLGEMYYCVSGQCVEASGCEAFDCCVPGEPGTTYCKETFGSCSMCQIIDNDGLCFPAECE